MKEHSFTIESEDKTKRTITSFIYGELVISKCQYNPNYWIIMNYPERVQIKDMTSKHIIVSGYGLGSEGLPSQVEGWVSSSDDRYVEAGTHRRDFPEGCEMWCVRRAADSPLNPTRDLSVEHVNSLCLQVGETAVIPAGDSLLVLQGQCLVNGKPIVEEKYYLIGQEPRTITAATKSYLLYWPAVPQQT